MWTHFWDMSSNGTQKLQWKHIFIEASEVDAIEAFKEIFDRDPNNVTCRCCGQDYSISSEESLKELTAPHRGCATAYFAPDGTEVSLDDAWARGKGFNEGFECRHVERQGYWEHDPTKKCGEYITLEQFELLPDVIIMRRTKELPQTLPALLPAG